MGLAAAGITSDLVGVGSLLRKQTLAVPAYQRNYAWTSEQVAAFWYDLQAALMSERRSHFLGTVVLSADPLRSKRLLVVDGQQRLATATLLVAAIRDAFADQGEFQMAALVNSEFLVTPPLSGQSEPRLLMNRNDVDFFQATVLGQPGQPAVPATGSHKLIATAFQQLTQFLREDLRAAGPGRRDRLQAWLDLLLDDARVILVRVQDDGDAFVIFETLNDRGLAMSINDLIKGYLFGLARHDLATAEAHWAAIDRELDDYSSANATNFLKHWWSVNHGATRERNLYRSIRRVVDDDPVQALAALASFSEGAAFYAAALDPTHESWSQYPPECRVALETLLRIGHDQYRPVLLAAQEHFASEALTTLLRNLVAWTTRASVVRQQSSTSERFYAEAAVRIAHGRSRSATDVLQDIGPSASSDEVFVAAFATRDGIRSGLARYLLTALSQNWAGSADASLVSDSAEAEFGVVNLLTAQNHWQGSGPGLASAVGRLGNMYLVPRRESMRLPNDLDARLESIRYLVPEAELPLNIESLNGEWVRLRQERMAVEARSVWPLRGAPA